MSLAKLIDYRNQHPQLWLPRSREEFEHCEVQTYESLVDSGFIDKLKTKSDTSVILRTGGTSSLAYKILPSSPSRFKYNDRKVSQRLFIDIVSYLWPQFLAQVFTDKVVFLPGNILEDGEKPLRYVSNALVSEKWRIGERFCPVSQEIFDGRNLPDATSKLRAIAQCYEWRNPAVISWVPWVILQFAQVWEELYHKPLRPQIAIVWGCAIQPYVEQLRSILWERLLIIAFYNATEGSFAYQPKHLRDTLDYSTMKFENDCGVRFEFMNQEWKIIARDNVVWDTDYILLVSTYDGLCRYQIGDIIRFTDPTEHYFKIVGRTSEYINIANEHTQLQHIQQTMSQIIDYDISWQYCVFASQNDGTWYYVLVIEEESVWKKTPEKSEKLQKNLNKGIYHNTSPNTEDESHIDYLSNHLAYQFDQALQIQNSSYGTRRVWGTIWPAQALIVEKWWFNNLIVQLNEERNSTQSKLLTLYPNNNNPVSNNLKS